MNDRQRQFTPSDCTTELTFCNLKSDSWNLNINDQINQTDNEKNLIINGSYIDIERQHQQQQLITLKIDEKTDLLSSSKQNLGINYIPQTSAKPISSNLVISNENPWKKLSNVRYKLDEDESDETTSSNYHHVYAQHITFV